MDLPDSIADKFTADEIREYVEQFKEVDDDGSGFLDPEEIGQLLKSLGNDKWDDDEYIKQLIEAVDEDESLDGSNYSALSDGGVRATDARPVVLPAVLFGSDGDREPAAPRRFSWLDFASRKTTDVDDFAPYGGAGP